MTGACALYHGTVAHARTRPRAHRLRHRLFMALLDLDDLPILSGRLRLFGHNRRALVSFHDKDHLGGSGDLRAEVREALGRAGIDIAAGSIRVLCMPRVLGFAFNPISAWYCHRPDGSLAAMLYEVNSTFGERHAYLIPVAAGQGPAVRQSCAKRLHVSPFMDMAMRYRFETAAPGERARLVVEGCDADGLLIAASFDGRRAPLTDGEVLKAFLAHPLLGLAVLAGIHWEALKLIAKGLRLRPGPKAPAEWVTVHAD